MERAFRRVVRPEDCLVEQMDREAYSYDASGLSLLPRLVLRPRDEEQLRRILQAANQNRTIIVARGAGSGTRGGALTEQGIIVDMRFFDSIGRLDRQRGTVDVGAGVTVERLNKALEIYDLHFPLMPEMGGATMGGLAAVNHITEESFLHGDYNDVVEQVECFDGLGRFQTLKGKDVGKVIGREGATGIITKLRVKVVPREKVTLEILPIHSAAELVAEAARWGERPNVLSLEFCDRRCSQLLGLGDELHLIVAFTDSSGSYKDVLRVKEILLKRKRLVEALWREGYRHAEEVSLDVERILAFLGYCEKERLPCYGHIGAGILITQLPKTMKRETFWNAVVALGATPGGKYGYGRLKQSYVPNALRREVLKLREERDYNFLLNKEVFA